MTLSQAEAVYSKILQTACERLKGELLTKAVAYATIRSKWPLMDLAQRQSADQGRTLAHNAFIDACNILSRNMAKVGEDNSWRADLGDERKRIGDFACYVALFLGLEAR